jgi:hypothetical protein
MEQHKNFIVLSLLLIYIVTINRKLFYISVLFFIALLLYLKKYIQISLFFLIMYLLSIVILNRKKEKFKNIKENFQDNKYEIKPSITNKVNDITNKGKQFSDSQHTMTMTNYQETFFVLNSIFDGEYLDKNKEAIEKILVEYRVNNLFDLAINILNKDQNVIYNNFLEKITCIGSNGDTNYLYCNNVNYNKLQGFSELYMVFCLDIEKIIELINVHKIYQLCDLAGKRYLLNDGEVETYQFRGLLYYLNERSFNDKYYEILKILELDKELDNPLMLRESLYNYNDKNKILVKDLNSIMVLFDFYNVFDKILLNYDEIEYNWELVILKSANLNQPYWDTISYFKDYKLKDRIIRAINKFTKSNEDIFSIELDDKCKKPEVTEKIKESEEEYKIISKNHNNCDTQEELVILKDLSLDYIIKNFTKKMNDIINDLIELFNNRCKVDCPDNDSMFGKYIFYFREIIKILSKDERIFFVGLLVLFIAILLNFIDLSN